MNPKVMELRALEKELDEFLTGAIHRRYCSDLLEAIDGVKEMILGEDPTDVKGMAAQLRWRGEWGARELLLSYFYSLRDVIRDEIEDLENEAGILASAKQGSPSRHGLLEQ